jgi:hypothetical protein
MTEPPGIIPTPQLENLVIEFLILGS